MLSLPGFLECAYYHRAWMNEMTAAFAAVIRKEPRNMSPHFYHFRVAVLTMTGLLVGFATAQDRESLKNPIYRVNNSGTTRVVPVATAVLPTRLAVVEPTPVPTSTKPDIKATADLAAAVKNSSASPVAAKTETVDKLASRAPITVPKPLHKPTPAETLGYAVSDAQLVLTHIKSNIRDYTCDFVKRERIGDELMPVEKIDLRVRNRMIENGNTKVPFSVYMKFRAPRESRNREILFVEGANNGKLLAKEGGARGKWLPSVWLRPDGPFAMKSSRYSISEVGMQRLAERLIESAGENKTPNLCKIKYIRGAKVNSRNCSYLEVVRDDRQPGPLGPNNIYLVQIFIDEQLKLPVRYAAYDWPTESGGKPRVLEEYTYQNIKLNVGLTDRDFSKDNPQYNF